MSSDLISFKPGFAKNADVCPEEKPEK